MKEKDPRVYLAAERTFLSWIRTGLAMMGFGFVIARFGLFLRELAAVKESPAQSSQQGISLWFGVGFVALGIVINIMAAWQYRNLINILDQGEIPEKFTNYFAITIALLLAITGLAVILYLLRV